MSSGRGEDRRKGQTHWEVGWRIRPGSTSSARESRTQLRELRGRTRGEMQIG